GTITPGLLIGHNNPYHFFLSSQGTITPILFFMSLEGTITPIIFLHRAQ
uniref:Uncharacterized protein n=1 Tax=Solanum lycopersicum TaxID=4081 RepID=A0A3Q7HL48_SOLLC